MRFNFFTIEDRVYLRANCLLIFFLVLWIIRITMLLQSSIGTVAINKYVILQLGCEFAMVCYLLKKKFLWRMLFRSKGIQAFAWLYLYALVSFIWSIFPAMSFVFAIENFIFLGVLFYFAKRVKDLEMLERMFLFLLMSLLIFFFLRTVVLGGAFHNVTYSTIGAILLCYCCGEYNSVNRSKLNLRWLKCGIVLGCFFLALCSSSGAMVSVVVGLLPVVFYSKNWTLKFLVFLFFSIGLILWWLGGVDIIISFLFPGKSMASIESAHGRKLIWELILEKAAERPWFGWGHCTAERIISWYCTDAHNSMIGALGSLGYCGAFLLAFAYIYQLIYVFKNRWLWGFKGILCSTICVFINSNSSNFIISRGGIRELAFFCLLILAEEMRIRQKRKIGVST